MDDPVAVPFSRTPGELVAFIEGNTVVAAPSLLPEMRLYLATEVTPLWHASEKLMQDAHLPPPFWAFAWPGGQAVARHLLDNPGTVHGRTVLDLGAGSGLVGIAAAMAGARGVVAVDDDAFACAAVGLNAGLNGVALRTAQRDVAALDEPDIEVIVAGDVCYEKAGSERIVRWLRQRRAAGIEVLLGDPGRAYVPKTGLELVAEYAVPTSTELESGVVRDTRVWRLTDV